MNEQQQSSAELKLIFTEKIKSDVKNKKIRKVLSKIDEINIHKKYLEKEQREFEKIKNLYKEIAFEADRKYCKGKERYIFDLSDRFFDRTFAKWHKELLYDMIMEQYELLDEKDYQTGNLDENRKKVKNYYSEEINPIDKEGAKQLYNELKKKGFGKNDPEFRPENFQDPDFRKKFGKKIEDDYNKKKEEERLLNIREKTLETDLDFHRIYKKLVKLTHPDLATSDEEKQEREYLMKRLTTAWENRDYYEILCLHRLIDKDNTIEFVLNDENTANIIRQLDKKIKELKYERFMTTSMYGENSMYVRFYSKYEAIVREKIENYVCFLRQSTAHTETFMAENLKNKVSTKRYLQRRYEEIIN